LQRTVMRAALAELRASISAKWLAVAEIGHVDVGAEPHVIGQVPSVVVGVFVDDDLIRIPEPAVAETNVIRRYAEVKAAEPETRRASTDEMPGVTAAKATGKAAVLPRMIEVVVGIVAAGVVTYPLIVRVNVRSVRMPGLVAKCGVLGRRMPVAFYRSWTVGGDVAATSFMRCTRRWMLRRSRFGVRQERKEQRKRKRKGSRNYFHFGSSGQILPLFPSIQEVERFPGVGYARRQVLAKKC
jgi:hypothetical protein